jgi:hypothetical protein
MDAPKKAMQFRAKLPYKVKFGCTARTNPFVTSAVHVTMPRVDEERLAVGAQ